MAPTRCEIHGTALNAKGHCLLCDHPELMTRQQVQETLDRLGIDATEAKAKVLAAVRKAQGRTGARR